MGPQTADLLATFEPRLDILPPAQKRLWPELSATPDEFTLHGGTAIALRMGHRPSVDFDFFATESFQPNDLLQKIPYLLRATLRQSAPDTLTVTVEREGSVQISFFGGIDDGQAEPVERAKGPAIKVASLIDLAGYKVSVVQQRGELKDYIDVHTLLTKAKIPLAKMLAAGKVIYGKQFSPLVALKALAYHEDRALAELSPEIRRDLIAAIKETDPQHLPALTPVKKAPEQVSSMKPLPHNPDLLRVAPRVVWFESAEEALANPVRFLTYVMTYATADEIEVVRRYVGLDDFREALEHAPPGIMDERSWAYWNAMTGRYPARPMPRREIP